MQCVKLRPGVCDCVKIAAGFRVSHRGSCLGHARGMRSARSARRFVINTRPHDDVIKKLAQTIEVERLVLKGRVGHGGGLDRSRRADIVRFLWPLL
eukprot:383248-Rhodomonas_salina.1